MRRNVLLMLLSTLCVCQVLVGDDHRLFAVLLFSGALVVWGLLIKSTDWSASKAIGSRFVLVAGVFLILAMVVIPPATSKDFNSYALYGRMAAEYGASPYTSTPRDFAADAWFERTSYYWSDSPSVYGPVFTGTSTGIMEVAGTSELKARAGFGLVAVGSLLFAVWLAGRRLGAGRSMLLVGLNPLVLTFGVNDLHCDVMVGAAVLAAVFAVERGRMLLGGIAIAVAISVKVSALPVLAGVVLWLWFHKRVKDSVTLVAGSIGVLGIGILAVGGLEAIAPITDAAGRQTRFSIWNPVSDALASWLGTAPPTLGPADKIVGVAASLCVAAAGLLLIWRHRRDASPLMAMVAGLVAYQVLGAYSLSWYAIWSIPALALAWRSNLAKIAMAHGCWIAIAYLNGFVAIAVAVIGIGAMLIHHYRSQRSGPSLDPHGLDRAVT